jgi:hypothetical protein
MWICVFSLPRGFNQRAQGNALAKYLRPLERRKVNNNLILVNI